MPLQCVLLAGGLGTRMRPFTQTRPKALIPVLGRPFAEWQLRQLAAQGIERVLYSIGHGGEMLSEYVGDGSRFGLTVRWISEGNALRGTAGALRLALERDALDEVFFVLYGDSYLPVEMSRVAAAWETSGLPALMTVLRNEGRWDRSNAIYADKRVVLYDKAGPPQSEMQWIDYGLSVITRTVIRERVPPDAVADLADLFNALSLAGQLAGYEAEERFYEAGSPQGLRDLETYLGSVNAG
jgi:NDP-sugar pyrophosphorylase family protein